MNIKNLINVTDDTFEDNVLKIKNYILVDFWAPWCNPCKILAPVLEEIALEYHDKLIIAKINIDDNPKTAPKYSIRGIPALLLFQDGILLKTKVGALSKLELTKFLNTYLV
ncbi:MAG TPA: thioredoxin TrxA [Buchnera sp. (in: enterobacteria)]|nr:thioredoxin TrxA [Buchnera sp. (in: enterobacteria)]